MEGVCFYARQMVTTRWPDAMPCHRDSIFPRLDEAERRDASFPPPRFLREKVGRVMHLMVARTSSTASAPRVRWAPTPQERAAVEITSGASAGAASEVGWSRSRCERALGLASTLAEAPRCRCAAGGCTTRKQLAAARGVCWRSSGHWTGGVRVLRSKRAAGKRTWSASPAASARSPKPHAHAAVGSDTPPGRACCETHIAVVNSNRIVRGMEDAWEPLRAERAGTCAVTFISGPSRTADISNGHARRARAIRVHIILIGAVLVPHS